MATPAPDPDDGPGTEGGTNAASGAGPAVAASGYLDQLGCCNTTTFRGEPLLIIFYLQYRAFAGLVADPPSPALTEVIDTIRGWATEFNTDCPDLMTYCPTHRTRGLIEAWPVRTCVLTAPMHTSEGDPARHMTVLPSRTFYFPQQPDGSLWPGTRGGVHIYKGPDLVYGAGKVTYVPRTCRYAMWPGSALPTIPSHNRYDTPFQQFKLRSATAHHIGYRGIVRSFDARPWHSEGLLTGVKRVHGVGPPNSAALWPAPAAGAPGFIWRANVQHWHVDHILEGMVFNEPSFPPGLYFRVQWTGWPEDPNWYPVCDFKLCPQKIQEYLAFVGHSAPCSAPARLRAWHHAYINAAFPVDHPDDMKLLSEW